MKYARPFRYFCNKSQHQLNTDVDTERNVDHYQVHDVTFGPDQLVNQLVNADYQPSLKNFCSAS